MKRKIHIDNVFNDLDLATLEIDWDVDNTPELIISAQTIANPDIVVVHMVNLMTGKTMTIAVVVSSDPDAYHIADNDIDETVDISPLNSAVLTGMAYGAHIRNRQINGETEDDIRAYLRN